MTFMCRIGYHKWGPEEPGRVAVPLEDRDAWGLVEAPVKECRDCGARMARFDGKAWALEDKPVYVGIIEVKAQLCES